VLRGLLYFRLQQHQHKQQQQQHRQEKDGLTALLLLRQPC
jgi:hypothetical protein